MTSSYDFSVIMAVYNAGGYLREAVGSILRQSFGTDRVQIILADDGSTDESGSLCDQLAREHPGSIQVIHQENRGVSAARNAGMALARGAWLNFMDADDRMGPETLETVFRFIGEHGGEADVFAVPVFFFEARDGEHWQNGKFGRGSRVIDLTEEYRTAQMMVNSAFFRREAVSDIRFDERLAISEDLKFAAEAMLKKQKLGVVSEGRYEYRRRLKNDSALNTQAEKPAWYAPVFRFSYLPILSAGRDLYGQTPRWLQFTVLCDLKWRAALDYQEQMERTLSPEEQEGYWQTLRETLLRTDDRVLEEIPGDLIEWPWKRWLARKKHPESSFRIKAGKDSLVYGTDELILEDLTALPAEIREVRQTSQGLRIRGLLRLPPELRTEPFQMAFRQSPELNSLCRTRFLEDRSVYRFGECLEAAYEFEAGIQPPEEGASVWQLMLTIPGEKTAALKCLVPGPDLPVSSLSSELGRTGTWKYILTPDALHLIPLRSLRARAASDLRLARDLLRGKRGDLLWKRITGRFRGEE